MSNSESGRNKNQSMHKVDIRFNPGSRIVDSTDSADLDFATFQNVPGFRQL